ncbi:MAG: hypothetical protein JNJ85_10035 [Candidatus Kapabacteria bacterium]|nr:hypothetical protein [Candidatus Kapabacteria bacterium]
MKKNVILIVSVILLAISPLVCFESLIMIVEHDEQEQRDINVLKQQKNFTTTQDSITYINHRDEFVKRVNQQSISDITLLASGIVTGITGIVMLIWRIRLAKSTNEN